jgi:microcystin degradation protein MlrC
MRFLLTLFQHETNTFSPVDTPVDRFFRTLSGDATTEQLRDIFRGSGTALGACVDAAEREGAKIVIATAAEA